jgi:hypothetical protein
MSIAPGNGETTTESGPAGVGHLVDWAVLPADHQSGVDRSVLVVAADPDVSDFWLRGFDGHFFSVVKIERTFDTLPEPFPRCPEHDVQQRRP